MTDLKLIKRLTMADSPCVLTAVTEGYDVLVLGDIARTAAQGGKTHMHVVREDARLAAVMDEMSFFAPDLELIPFPAWDCLPYDRVGPHGDIIAARMDALSKLTTKADKPRILVTTINAVLQRVPPKEMVQAASFAIRVGEEIDQKALINFLSDNGYIRASQVMEAGEFAVRGSLIDIFAAGHETPARLDFFGDELESIRLFDPLSQRTTGMVKELTLKPVSEFILDADTIQRFRREYQNTFGPASSDDPLYQAIKEGRRYQGAEHWLPLFHDRLDTVFNYLDDTIVTLDHNVDLSAGERFDAITDYYEARVETQDAEASSLLSAPYNPLKPKDLYLSSDEWEAAKTTHMMHQFSPFNEGEANHILNFKSKMGRDFGVERNQKDLNPYDALKEHIDDARKAEKRVVVAAYSAGSLDRLQVVMQEHKIRPIIAEDSWVEVNKSDERIVSMVVLPIPRGFETDNMILISEQDILGDRLVRKSRRNKKADNFLTEASALTEGDLVVHSNHGIGRFLGLETVTAGGANHDCLLLEYLGGDKLYVPVENIEVLTRYGAEDVSAQLDKLGGVAWQGRKAKLKKRIRDMADALIGLAAERALKRGEKLTPPEGMYDEFCARFPFTETDDQQRAIHDVIRDLGKGQPMDRLICGDVGFGKTEVSLRAAFVTVMAGQQVAIVAPTTLLARQHYKTFTERFKGLPVRIEHLSRLVSAKDIKQAKKGLADGQADIVIGTHALLAKDIRFSNLGLLVIDEEQHFGVAHKERLKQLRANVHVLTLTATPIPRTLQLSLTGIRDLSIIATPPVDRLAVRTFTLPFDPVVIREALLREHHRGGQSFYVCPRIADLDQAAEFLKEQVPEVKFIVAHGQMPPKTIEDVMTAFYEGKYDVLLSTTIIESGIDIPTANTIVVHRADMFGLSQLYQLRGRVGRSKTRAYAYLTIPPKQKITENAEKRLQVLQTLDTLGAGFTIASHDMDIRGAGNLLGDEQSGHVKEVGVELYQQMLEEAVAKARAGADFDEMIEDKWSPQLNLGATVMIPESYVPDLNQRMALYRRLADLESRQDVDAFTAELIDRFGPLPNAVKQLAAIMIIKSFCKTAGIERMDAGAKGVTLHFRNKEFANPAGMIDFISNSGKKAKLRPDHSLVFSARMDKIGERLKTTAQLARNLAKIADATNSD